MIISESSRPSHHAIIFTGRSIIMMLATMFNVGCSSPILSTVGGEFSIRPPPLIASLTISINNDQRIPRSAKRRGEEKYRISRIIRRRNAIHRPSSSTRFSRRYHDDPEYEWYDEMSASGSIGSGFFDRQKFVDRQLLIGVVPNDRRGMNMALEVGDEDDEWERYLNVDDISSDDSDVHGSNINIEYSQTSHLGKDRVRRITADTSRIRYDATTSKKKMNAFTSMRGNQTLGDNGGGSVNDSTNRYRSSEMRNQLPVPDDDSIGSQRQSISNAEHPRRHRKITPDQISDIKASISLVDVIESYNLAQFTRMGNSHSRSTSARACCPFHDDHNPSMSIDDSRGLYKCFACGAGGDVFNFIREFDYLSKVGDGREKMGYMQAVEFAVREFGGSGDDIGIAWDNSSGASSDESDDAKKIMRQRDWKKERIRQANTAAAAFYTKCLITLPSAGKARAHLRSRKISPESVKSFAIGYAPDCYYGDEAKITKAPTGNSFGPVAAKAAIEKCGEWGSGSLVEHLAGRGFAPNEIVESGLAVRTKTKQLSGDDRDRRINDSSSAGGGDEILADDDRHDYSDLMDRFRSRLIIPIMDDGGQHVIALGGRHLQAVGRDDDVTEGGEKNTPTSFAPAKYINSPDSLVFAKKNVLFNKARAKRALDEYSLNSKISSGAEQSSISRTTFVTPPSIVIVEGYFDVIALSNIGIQNVVSSMGTALPVEQLKLVAEMRNSVPGGRIILCLDGDDAGKNAVERLFSSNILSNVPELSKNELYVATLFGDGVKDPSDFVNMAGGGDKARMRFQEEILDNAIPWDEWYIDRLISKHEMGAKDGMAGSFSGICNEVSTFLAFFVNPAERTRRVHKISEKLVVLIAEDKMSSSSLSMLRCQLESDILNMSSRKAGVREAIERRIELTDGVSGEATASKMKRLSSGDLDDNNNDERKMSKNALAMVAPQRPDGSQRNIPASNPLRQGKGATRARSFRTNPRQRNRQLPEKPTERHLVPHFNGFVFKHQSDRDWLGLSDNSKMKPKMHLGEAPGRVEEKDRLRAETPIFEDNIRQRWKKEDVLYFNSNRYLGQQYLLPQAIRAGYELGNERPSPGESLIEFTERKLFQSPDPDQLIIQAESRLLHALAKFPQARMAMRSVYSTSTFGPSNLRWTSEERKWLFLCLTGSPKIDPPLPAELLDGGTQCQLHSYLANREDCPCGSFNKNIIKPVNDRIELSTVIESIVETSTDQPEYEPSIMSEESVNNSFGRTQVEILATENAELDSILDVASQAEVEGRIGHQNGLLDEYFLETDMFPSFDNNKITKEARAELTVQETISTLLRASAMKRFSMAKENLTRIVNEMDRRGGDDRAEELVKNDLDGLSSEELEMLFEKVGNEVIEAQRSLYDADRSTERVNSHLLDYSLTNGIKYKLSQSELERLDKMMDDHIASLPDGDDRPETPGNDTDHMFSVGTSSMKRSTPLAGGGEHR
ncbi:hypothetical protein ACHAXA_008504 [Cyclostephanos tholiformis]|uniref:Toprim domain-containing protein n=1 Tax=Cyclostephanos tholiformis TaxID=382380 RepID=A0ABD3RR93_9STRA